jgi:hypothetical protein
MIDVSDVFVEIKAMSPKRSFVNLNEGILYVVSEILDRCRSAQEL